MAAETRFTDTTLRSFGREALQAAGAPAEHAATVADHLADANLTGHDSHGVHRLAEYTQAIADGRIDPRALPRVVRERSTTLFLDAEGVLGQVAAAFATDRAIAMAKEHGTAVVGARGANHVGRAGVYALSMAEAGLIGQVWCSGNGAAIVAPWGGREPRLSTNPIAIGVPTAAAPIVVDITTSVTAEGKVRVARNAGKQVPDGQILDQEGKPSNNPQDLYEGGSMLPLGGDMGHKGYGLSVAVDLLGALVNGSGAGKMASSFSNSFTLFAIDPEAFAGTETMLELQQQYFAMLRSSAPKPGVREILLPGEPEQRNAAARRQEGVVVDAGSLELLDKMAERLGLASLSERALRD